MEELRLLEVLAGKVQRLRVKLVLAVDEGERIKIEQELKEQEGLLGRWFLHEYQGGSLLVDAKIVLAELWLVTKSFEETLENFVKVLELYRRIV